MNLPIFNGPPARVRRQLQPAAPAIAQQSGDPRMQCELCCKTDPSTCANIEGCSCPLLGSGRPTGSARP